MSLLFKTMARNNALLLLPALFVGTGLYVLTDLFDRLDNFIDAKVELSIVVWYFIYKIPLIISQILPVVFLLATVIQLCLMTRSREMMALQAGGISPLILLRMLFICGLFWAVVQLGFSQWLGVGGENSANRIWQEQVRKRNMEQKILENIWFSENNYVVSLNTLYPDGTGKGFLGYEISDDGLIIEAVIQAESFLASAGHWKLENVVSVQPQNFKKENFATLELPLKQDISSFRIIHSGTNPQQLSLWQLGQAIGSLQDSGSNVESLRTAWHSKIAYAASIIVMTLVSMAIVSWRDNVYIATGTGLIITFLYYAIFTVTNTIGQQGLISPFLAAWCANLLAVLCVMIRLVPIYYHKN